MVLIDAIAARRGKWAHEVLSLTPEQLSMELVCLRLHGERRNAEAKGALRVAVAGG